MTKNKKAARGRPEIPAKERRNTSMQFRVTSDEQERIKKHAKKSGLSLSNWLRDNALSQIEE